MLTRLRLENFKSWEDTGEIALKPITGFFGPNSSGKTSLFQALLLLKQTDESPDRGIGLHFGDEKTLVDLGDFESVVHKHEAKRTLKFSLGWNVRHEFEIPDPNANSMVAKGDEIGFRAEIRQRNIRSEKSLVKSLVLEKMSYKLADGREFGLRRRPNRKQYVLIPDGTTFEFRSPSRPPFKFNRFPFWTAMDSQHEDLFFELQYAMKILLEDMFYLGPLRANPHRIYHWSGAQPSDMGPAGESVVDAMLFSRQKGDRILVAADSESVSIDEYVAAWLKRLGLVHDFRVEALARGRRLFEVKVRKSANSAEVLLADVGFGVSQILPVLVLCFYAPEESTVILDHPDIHLHPSAQAGLADVFIDAWKKHHTQIMFESHSEHLLRRLQRRIAEEKIGQNDVSLFFCSTNSSGGSTLSQLEVDQLGNISNWPEDFFGDQFGEIAAMSDAALARQGDSE